MKVNDKVLKTLEVTLDFLKKKDMIGAYKLLPKDGVVRIGVRDTCDPEFFFLDVEAKEETNEQS